MNKVKQWGVTLTVVTLLVGVLEYQTRSGKVGLAKAKSEVNFSILQPNNADCSITGTDGVALNLSNIKVIPKGTLVTGSCFGLK